MADPAFWENDKTTTEAAFWEKDSVASEDWWKQDKETEPETVHPRAAQMASAMRHTLGVVGRAVSAFDIASAGADVAAPNTLEGVDESGRPLDPRGRNPAQAAPNLFESRTPEPALSVLMKPLLTLPRVTGQEVTDALHYLASFADMPPEYSEAMRLHNATPGNLEKIIAGAQRAAVAVPEAFTSPVGIATLGTGVLPAAAGRVIAGGFSLDMASHIPEQVSQLKAAIASGDSERITEASGNLLVTGAMVGVTGKHALTKPNPAQKIGVALMESIKKTEFVDPKIAALRQVAPITAEAVAKTGPITPTGEGNTASGSTVSVGRTPLTTEAVAKVVEKEPVVTPAPTPAAVAGESGQPAPVTAGVEPPAKLEVAQTDPVAKQESERSLTTEAPVPKWTTATRAGVDLVKQTLAGMPDPVATVKAVIALAKEASPYVKRAGESVARANTSAKEGVGEFVGEQFNAAKMTDYRRSVLNWSSKLQQSFGEADSAQRDIRKAVPDAIRREGITNWIQADGDPAVLRARADATADPKLKAGYEAALALTPEEIAVANDVRTAFAELGTRGQTYDVLNSFKENYVTQTWDLGRGPATGSSRTLKDKFRFSKASTFPTYFDGEQAGYVPKTKDIAKILPMYLHEMNSVIAARQLVQEMAGGVGSDGRPLLAARGGGVPVEGDGGKATLIMPTKSAKDTGDYKVIENQPALSGWRWASKDTEGNPIFLKADLALHPEAYSRLKNVLGKSAIREWYNTRTSAAAQIPKMLIKGLDVGQAETKRTMLGFFAPFHQVQEGTHAVGHRVNPFRTKEGGLIDRATGGKLPEALKMPKIDLVNNAAQQDATRHGLMLLPDRTSADQFMEGFRHSGLISRIPKIGPAADWYSHYLFQEYIPGLKFKTYENILKRNQHVYAKELASGAVKLEDIKVLSAEQSNAAYGHLNYADLGRNPTVQHGMQMFLLAPDFFEARGRFAAQGAKGITGAKVGREQILALATLAVTQATTAWIAAQVTGGTWDHKHPFEMVLGDRRYTMRSVPEDLAGLITDARRFIYSRLSPIIGKGIVQGLSGVDYKGDKVTAGDTLKELAQSPIPLPLRGFVGTSNRNLTAFEELAGSVGLRISRYYPEDVTHAMQLRDEVDLWINRSKKLDTDEERANYLNKQLQELSTVDRKKAVIRIKQRTAPGVRKRVQ